MRKRVFSVMLAALLLLGCLPLTAAAEELPELETEQHIIYIEGTQDLVNPEGNLTRAEAAKIVCTLMKAGEEPYPMAGSTFPDVPATSWCEPYVRRLTDLGVFKGYSDGTFGPTNPITRAEFVQVLSRFFEPETTDVVFTDVPEDFWGLEAISTAVAKGWTKGYGDGTFGPWRNITRAEAITMMNRVLGRSADRTKIAAGGPVLRFLDLPQNHWAYYEIMEASLPHEHEIDEEGVESWQSYTVPPAQRGEGPQYYGGETYYVSNGRYVQNADAAGMHFNANGHYTTGDAELDRLVGSIFRSRCKETNTPEQNLRAMFDYVYAQTHYRTGEYIADGATDWINRKAKETINNGYKGNCYNYAALMTVLAQRAGVQATAYSGWVKFTFQGWVYHAWCEVTIDGQRYICDPELEANFVKNLGLGWKLYKVPYASLPYLLRCKGVIFQ